MDFKSMISTFISDYFTSDITPKRVIIVMVAALLFCVYLFLVYRFTVKDEFYSKDFNRSMGLMVVVTAAVVLGLQSNLVISLGMVGALSIVRYRTAVKSSLDLLFLYWAVAMGILCGASLFTIALVLCVVMTAAIFILGHTDLPVPMRMLAIHCSDSQTAAAAVDAIKPIASRFRVKNKTVTKLGTELIVEYKSKSPDAIEEALNALEGVTEFSMLDYDRENR